MSIDADQLVERVTRALGPPVATPERVMAADYYETHRLEYARYRTFRWCCPCCGAGREDPPYRPFVIDSDGNVLAECCEASTDEIASAIRILLDVEAILDSIEVGP